MNNTELATEFRQANASPGLLLWRLSNEWQAKQRAALKPFDLTHTQFVLLASLSYAANKRELTQKQLAEFAHTDVMMTSQVVRKLEQKGLVSRHESKYDGRAVTLAPTVTGLELVNKAVVVVESVDRIFFEKIGKDLPQLIKTMRQLTQD
ncbi:MAG TPA: MarR family winged helix-turn-helix transcriptional regulator [Candidatus Saccharimonadales bacterium]|nr:MarR family winged helix-turn-helix transcriptional regulator [Candidatus Saccharimonadales bacterium]